MNNNNELEVLSYLSDSVLPSQKIIHNGGNASNCADLIVIDRHDPQLNQLETTIKAHYIITGNNLYLHSTDYDPWNIAQAMDDLGIPVETIEDRKVQISKRPAGAVRKNGGSGSLKLGDYRHCQLAIRFWPSYPREALDLSNPDHQDAVFNRLFDITKTEGFIPHATIDAKANQKTQFIGPTLLVKKEAGQIAVALQGKDIETSGEIIDHIQNSSELTDKFYTYLSALGVDKSTFRIVHEDDPSGVPESVYKKQKFNVTLNMDFGLSSHTFRKNIVVKCSESTAKVIAKTVPLPVIF